jgi:hypothetical protein
VIGWLLGVGLVVFFTVAFALRRWQRAADPGLATPASHVRLVAGGSARPYDAEVDG